MPAQEEVQLLRGADAPSHSYSDGGADGGHGIQPITLAWRDVSVYVTCDHSQGCYTGCSLPRANTVDAEHDGAREKRILDKVRGVVKPGSLLAIMGASGAGKTTLMNVLTSRSSHRLRVEGHVTVNGRTLGDKIKYVSAYVQQDDFFVSSLTVTEHLWFQAVLRLDGGLTNSMRRQRVKDVIIELGMVDIAASKIGVPGSSRAMSGGERKRLTFASEVLTNPALMFCDEPTSGLDSFMAQNVIETLRQMASRGRTILCTIHQPSSEVYRHMDRVCLMAEGRVAYIGTTENVIKFFNGVGFPCPPSFNPADFFIHTLAVIPGREEECRKRVKSICDVYSSSAHSKELQANTARYTDRDTFIAEMVALSETLIYKGSWWSQFKMLFWRGWLNNIRDPMLNRARVIQTLIQAIVISYLYFRTPYDQTGVFDINGAFFMIQSQITFGNVFGVCNSLPRGYNLFLREHHNGVYRVITYYLTLLLVEAVIFVINPVVFALILYWTVGLYNTASSFFTTVGALVMLSLDSMAFGHLLGTLTCDAALAVALVPLFLSPFMYFGGFFLNFASVPWYVKPLQWISWFSYSNEILVVNQWKDVQHLACETKVPTYAEINATMVVVGYDESMCYHDGADVIRSLSFSQENVPFDFGAMAILFISFEVIAYLLLVMHSKKKQ